MNLLEIIQEAITRSGLSDFPTSAISSTDQTVRQMVAQSNADGRFLVRDYPWQTLIKEKTFDAVAQEDQGAINTIVSDLSYILNETIWNRTQNRPLLGPNSPAIWQAYKASSITFPYSEYRIRGGRLLFIPSPAAGDDIFFEYVSKNWVSGSNIDQWQMDDEVSVFDDELMVLGAIWRTKKAKGFDFSGDLEEYRVRLDSLKCRDGSKKTHNMAYPLDLRTRHLSWREGGFGT